MYNWSVDEKYLQKNPKAYKLWKMEQMINYGLDNEKLEKKEVLANWDYLKNRLDPRRRSLIEFFLWPKQS